MRLVSIALVCLVGCTGIDSTIDVPRGPTDSTDSADSADAAPDSVSIPIPEDIQTPMMINIPKSVQVVRLIPTTVPTIPSSQPIVKVAVIRPAATPMVSAKPAVSELYEEPTEGVKLKAVSSNIISANYGAAHPEAHVINWQWMGCIGILASIGISGLIVAKHFNCT